MPSDPQQQVWKQHSSFLEVGVARSPQSGWIYNVLRLQMILYLCLVRTADKILKNRKQPQKNHNTYEGCSRAAAKFGMAVQIFTSVACWLLFSAGENA